MIFSSYILVSLDQFMKKFECSYFENSGFSCATITSTLVLSGFFRFASVLCRENYFVLHELVEEEVNKGAGGDLEKTNLSKQATDNDRSLEMVCCFALKFCWLTLVLKNIKFGVMIDTLRESRLGWPIVRSIIGRLLFSILIKPT